MESKDSESTVGYLKALSIRSEEGMRTDSVHKPFQHSGPAENGTNCPDCGAKLPADSDNPVCLSCLLGESICYFGDYELLGELGRGGMGVVYRARQISLNRIVAVKTMRHDGPLGSHPDSVRRFQNEAEAAASLDHPNIVPVYEVGSHNGFHYLSMKFIEGSCLGYDSFDDVLLGGAVARCRAVASVVAKVANAIHYAHQRGVLHRDLKPANILIGSDGIPFVTDFGLAKLLNTAGDITRTGQFLGTPAFVSPEQADGHSSAISVATDIYGLGAVLYALLVGKPPFEGESHLQILDLVRRAEPVSPARIDSSVDPDLATICLKCLEKNTSRRYPSAAAMQADLEHWLAGEPITARPVGNLEKICKWIRRHPVTSGLSTLLLSSILLSVLGIAWQWRRAEAGWFAVSQSNERFLLSHADEAFDRGESSRGLALLARALRDHPQSRVARMRTMNSLCHRSWLVPVTNDVAGDMLKESGWHLDAQSAKRVAYQARWSAFATNAQNILIQDVSGTRWPRVLNLPSTGVIRCVRIDDVGNSVAAAVSDGDVFIWSVGSGQLLRTISRGDPINDLAFSPGGQWLATANSSGNVYLYSASTGELIAKAFAAQGHATAVYFSSDGSRLIMGGDDGVIKTVHVPSFQSLSEPRRVSAPIDAIWMSPSSPSLVFVRTRNGGRLAYRFIDGEVMERTSPFDTAPNLEAITSILGVAATNFHQAEIISTQVSSDGLRIATGSMDKTARIWDVRTRKSLSSALVHPSIVNCVQFSPDGKLLATASAGPECRIRVWDGKSGLPITDWFFAAEPVLGLKFSKEGRQLVASSGQTWGLHLANSDPRADLADLVEAIVGLRFDDRGGEENIGYREAVESLQRILSGRQLDGVLDTQRQDSQRQ